MLQKSTDLSRAGKITCSICIATYKRQQLLENLLLSLLNQVLPDNILMEIIVVDNDEQQSAKETVNKIQSDEKSSISYYHQPIKNISLTRNMALNNANGQFIVFIDDDETASEHWIYNLLKASFQFEADGVFGYVIPKFSPGAPHWMQQREIYFRPMRETGSPASFTFTTNCLLKSKIVKDNDVSFDPRYGLTGGEDVLFFDNLRQVGAKFVNCKEAITYEFVPNDRTKIRYIFSKSLQGGLSYARRMIELNSDKVRGIRLKIFVKAMLAVIFYSVQVLFLIFNRRKFIISFTKLSANIGKLAAVFNLYYEHYKK